MIHRIRVTNYKSIVDVNVLLTPVTVLIGTSGTGKSNFLESIKTLQLLLMSGSKLPSVLPSIWKISCHAGRQTAELGFEVEFSVSNMSERFTYKVRFSNPNFANAGFGRGPTALAFLKEEFLGLGSAVLFHQQDQAWVKQPDTANPMEPSNGLALGGLPTIPESVIAFAALTSGIGIYSFSDDVMKVGSPRGNANNPVSGATSGFHENGDNFLDILKEIANNLQDLHVRKSMVSTLQKINPTVASVELDNIQQPTKVMVGHRFSDTLIELDINQESAGFRRFYAHLLALYQRPPKLTLLFEHPEDGIHPGALELLSEEFVDAAETSRGQVVFTTHNPMLLDHFKPEQMRVVCLDDTETRIGPVAPEQIEAIKEDLLAPGQLLTVDPARIDSREGGCAAQ